MILELVTGAEVVRCMAGTLFDFPETWLLRAEAGGEGTGKDEEGGCALCLMTSRASLVSCSSSELSFSA